MFTLIHELCHIWIGHSGVSDGDARTTRQEEVLCNAVAAEFLVPGEEFTQLWQPNTEHWQDNLAPLELHFRVSKWVLARRTLTLKFIRYDDYAGYMRYLLDANTYIQAKNQYYGMDICPAYWQWLDLQCEKGIIGSVDMIAQELKDGKDELAK